MKELITFSASTESFSSFFFSQHLVFFVTEIKHVILTHSYLETHKRSEANSADPDQTLHNVASDLSLQCLPR